MDDHFFVGDAIVHRVPLRFRDRLMCAKGGHDVDLYALFSQVVIVNARDLARLRMEAREIRRDDEHLLERSSFQRRF